MVYVKFVPEVNYPKQKPHLDLTMARTFQAIYLTILTASTIQIFQPSFSTSSSAAAVAAASSLPSNCTISGTSPKGEITNATCINTIIQSLPNLPSLQEIHFLRATSQSVLPLNRLYSFNLVNLNQLRVLFINEYNIMLFTQDVFASNGLLEHLDLSKNSIANLESRTFEGLTNLKILNLSKNKITSIDSTTFQSTPKVETINLEDNELIELDPEIFSNLPHLLTVNLQRNRIVTILDNEILGTSLKWLNLNYNMIISIPTKLLTGASNRNLDVLMVRNNATELKKGDLANIVLKSLNLKGNVISLVHPDALQNTFINTLDLQQNRLHHLPPGLENHLNLSNTILLADNPWSCDCSIQWLARIINTTVQKPLCDSPSFLHGQSIADIDTTVLCSNFSFPVPSAGFAVPPRQEHAVTPALMPKTTELMPKTTETSVEAKSEQTDADNSTLATAVGVIIGVILLILLIAIAVLLTMPRVKVSPELSVTCRRPDQNFNPHLVKAYEPVEGW